MLMWLTDKSGYGFAPALVLMPKINCIDIYRFGWVIKSFSSNIFPEIYTEIWLICVKDLEKTTWKDWFKLTPKAIWRIIKIKLKRMVTGNDF
jgi:hypothetical protein